MKAGIRYAPINAGGEGSRPAECSCQPPILRRRRHLLGRAPCCQAREVWKRYFSLPMAHLR
eukprot:2387661-Pyramimonas_sp.AAC.1